MKSLTILFLIVLNLYSVMTYSSEEQFLINHVKTSLKNAHVHESKLIDDILKIEGMSGAKVRHLLNNICSLPNANYLEIGVWKGSTFISALYNNTNTLSHAIAIDNWTEFAGPQDIFLKNTNYFLPRNAFKLYNADCFKIDQTNIFTIPINIFFYDGNHSFESQRKAFTYYNDCFDDVFIAIVDDWSWIEVQRGTKQAFQELNYTILFEQELQSNTGSDAQNWWNGLYIAVIKKG